MIIDGKAIAAQYQDEVRLKIASLKQRKPALAVILVGDDPASVVYVNRKREACEHVGILSLAHYLPSSTPEDHLLRLIDQLNNDPTCDGILVQLPLPRHINATKVMHALDPQKDVDGFHPVNMGKLLIGETDGFVPCTPLGIQVMLEKCKIDLNEKHIVIIGRSTIVGKPMAALLMRRAPENNVTVTIAGRNWPNMAALTSQADVLITALGIPHRFTADMIREDAVVIDVGINRVPAKGKKGGFRLVGDVDYENVRKKARAITPVPGGVGPMTIAMLIRNTLQSYSRSERLQLL